MTVTPQGGVPAWAASVEAFADATSRSHVIAGGTQLQFPDTSQLGGLCGNLLGGSAFTSGLGAYGDPSQGQAGQIVTGTQGFADTMCGMLGGSGSGTSPQSLQAGATDVSNAVYASPMAAGTIGMGQDGGPSGNTALDAINGMQNFANSMFSIVQGCGCSGNNSPAEASPQQIIDTSQQTADAITANPMSAGVLALGQVDGGTGNVALDGINGASSFGDSLFSIFSGCGCGSANAPSQATPQQVIDQAQQTADAITGNPLAAGVLAMGQTDGGTGNVALDGINGASSFGDALFSICSGCGCGSQNSPSQSTPGQLLDQAQITADKVTSNPMASGVIALGQTPVGSGNVAVDAMNGGQTLAGNMFGLLTPCGCGSSMHPDTVTPNALYSTAQQTADAVSASPVGSTMIAIGQLGGSSGNVATDLINGADQWFTGVNDKAVAAGHSATAAQDTAVQAGTAAANVAAAVAQQQAAAIANDRIGGDYVTLVPVGSDGAALPADWTAEGPATNDVCIRGGYGFAGIKATLGVGTYWAVPAFTYQTDSQYIAVVLGDEGGDSAAHTTLYFHATATLSAGAYLRFSYLGFELGSFTKTGGVFTYTPFPSGSLAMLLLSGQTVGVRNVGNSYSVLVNGQTVLTYVGGSVTMDATHRTGAVSMSRVLESA